jgi:hypothetical protein
MFRIAHPCSVGAQLGPIHVPRLSAPLADKRLRVLKAYGALSACAVKATVADTVAQLGLQA